MKRTNNYSALLAILFLSVATSCSDFFSPDTDDTLSSDDYISSQTEVYTGYIGIITKLQAIGDKSIYLTDTRGELLEPTETSTSELIALYNYDADLQGNSYADPAGYYEVVIACNDYLDNMRAFRQQKPELAGGERFDALESLTLRVKVWAYLTLAEIYGQAVWFDDSMIQIQDLSDTSKFKLMTLDEVVDKCIDLLDNGDASTDFINGKLKFSWYEWLDPETALADSEYRYWDYMTPPYEGLMAKLCLWKGAALQGKGSYDEAKVYYQTCADLMLEALNNVISDTSRDYYYLPTAATPGNYARLWDNPEPHAREVVCAIIYDYQRNQTNKLLHHFSSEYPNKYMLRPCMDVVYNRLENGTFNPGWSSDKRTTVICAGRGGKPFLAKYRPIGSTRRPDAFQDDVHIYLFRATEYHFFLMEALNGLGRFSAADALLNAGIKADYFEKDADGNMVKDEDGYGTPIAGFEGFTNDWSAQASWGTRKYPHMGIRGCFGITPRPFNLSADIAADGSNLMELMEANDMAILDECLLEFAGEGKVYPTMIRMAKRWGNGDYKRSVVSDRVSLKYGAKADEMRPKIESQIFVPWDLKLQ